MAPHTIIGVVILAGVGYFLYRWLINNPNFEKHLEKNEIKEDKTVDDILKAKDKVKSEAEKMYEDKKKESDKAKDEMRELRKGGAMK